MPSGGARTNSGPPADPHSGRSDARGLTFTRLPAEGYAGKAPKFPLPDPSAREWQIWRDIWTTPQAAVWAEQPWRWADIGLYVRLRVRVEEIDSQAALVTNMLRIRDELGLSLAGMRANGWVISTDQLAPLREDDEPAAAPAPPKTPAKDRLRVAHGGA